MRRVQSCATLRLWILCGFNVLVLYGQTMRSNRLSTVVVIDVVVLADDGLVFLNLSMVSIAVSIVRESRIHKALRFPPR